MTIGRNCRSLAAEVAEANLWKSARKGAKTLRREEIVKLAIQLRQEKIGTLRLRAFA